MRVTAMILALALPAFVFDTWDRPARVSQTAAKPVDRKTKGAGAAAVKEMGKDSKP